MVEKADDMWTWMWIARHANGAESQLDWTWIEARRRRFARKICAQGAGNFQDTDLCTSHGEIHKLTRFLHLLPQIEPAYSPVSVGDPQGELEVRFLARQYAQDAVE
jgi:hypothetical protein